jgi:hypothetical protein
MSQNAEKWQAPSAETGRPIWETPSLSSIGHVRQLVRGGGKSGTNSDSDPTNTTKTGMG